MLRTGSHFGSQSRADILSRAKGSSRLRLPVVGFRADSKLQVHISDAHDPSAEAVKSCTSEDWLGACIGTVQHREGSHTRVVSEAPVSEALVSERSAEECH